jgi:hypothetical protein
MSLKCPRRCFAVWSLTIMNDATRALSIRRHRAPPSPDHLPAASENEIQRQMISEQPVRVLCLCRASPPTKRVQRSWRRHIMLSCPRCCLPSSIKTTPCWLSGNVDVGAFSRTLPAIRAREATCASGGRFIVHSDVRAAGRRRGDRR